MFDGLNAESGRDMGLARARAADQDDILGTVHALAAMQLTAHHPRLQARFTPLSTAFRLATTMFLSMPTPNSVEPSASRNST